MSDKNVTAMKAVMLPTKQIDFLRKNPKLAEVAGKAMISLIEVNTVKKKIEDMIADPEFLKRYMENGTDEELKEFITVVLVTQNQALVANNLPPGAFEKIQEKLGDGMLATAIKIEDEA